MLVKIKGTDKRGEIENNKNFLCGGCVYDVHMLNDQNEKTKEVVKFRGRELEILPIIETHY